MAADDIIPETPHSQASQEQHASHPNREIKITGRFGQHDSSYWKGALAVLPARYGIRPFLRHHWDNEKATAFNRHKYGGLAGGLMYGVAGYYAASTWNDIKAIFAQSLAWEFNKSPEDVSYKDFVNSKNTIVRQTMDNFKERNLLRFAVNTMFFVPLLVSAVFKKPLPAKLDHPELGVDMGIFSNAAYLFSDVMSRKISTFETLQYIIDSKINHTEHVADQMSGSDLLDIYERHAAKTHKPSFREQRGTDNWDKSTALFDRMADLINQAHHNTAAQGDVEFDISAFIYLVGHGMINPREPERACAYVEIFNRHGIEAVKEAATREHEVPVEGLCAQYRLPPLATGQGQEIQEIKPLHAEKVQKAAGAGRRVLEETPAFSIAHREEQRRSQQAENGYTHAK